MKTYNSALNVWDSDRFLNFLYMSDTGVNVGTLFPICSDDFTVLIFMNCFACFFFLKLEEEKKSVKIFTCSHSQ